MRDKAGLYTKRGMGKEVGLELEGGSAIDIDDRREAAIASTLYSRLQKNSTGASSNQLAKLQELHRRRLKIKSKTKSNAPKKSQDGSSSYQHKDSNPKDSADEDASIAIESSSLVSVKIHNINTSSVEQENVAAEAGLKKRRKLHWGLDTKERWERKANM